MATSRLRQLIVVVSIAIGASALSVPADMAVWSLRGKPTQQLQVTRLVVAPLKGNKEEYYPDGTETVTCSRSLYAQTPDGACWFVEKHRVLYER